MGIDAEFLTVARSLSQWVLIKVNRSGDIGLLGHL